MHPAIFILSSTDIYNFITCRRTMDNSDGSFLGVMEDKKGYEMFVFL